MFSCRFKWANDHPKDLLDFLDLKVNTSDRGGYREGAARPLHLLTDFRGGGRSPPLIFEAKNVPKLKHRLCIPFLSYLII